MDMLSARILQRRDDVQAQPTVSREQVTAALYRPTRAVDARTAQQRTTAFYRSSGFDWAQALS